MLCAACSENSPEAAVPVSPGTSAGTPASAAPVLAVIDARSAQAAAIVTTSTASPSAYVFPFVGRAVSYGTTHHDYPATDVFGCGAIVVAPTDGEVVETRDADVWDPATDLAADRGGRFVSMVGHDGVRYYFAHLDIVLAVVGQVVRPGDPLGVMGSTGNARGSACHTHMGISRPCPAAEWAVRRGEVWPAPYLDAWRVGEPASPVLEVYASAQADPAACDSAADLAAAPG